MLMSLLQEYGIDLERPCQNIILLYLTLNRCINLQTFNLINSTIFMPEAQHTVQSPYRGLCSIIKSIALKLYPLKKSKNSQKPQLFQDFQYHHQGFNLPNQSCLELLVFYMLNCLTKQKRTKENLQCILLMTARQFKLLCQKFEIPDKFDFTELKEAQVTARSKICEQYKKNAENYWKEYQAQIKKKQNLIPLRKFIDKIILEDGLGWELSEDPAKKKRINVKNKIGNSAHVSEESIGEQVSTMIQEEPEFDFDWRSMLQSQSASQKIVQLRLIQQTGNSLLLYSAHKNCTLNGQGYCSLCGEQSRRELFVCQADL